MTPAPHHTASREILRALRRIVHRMDLHSRALVRRYGLTGPQIVLLQELALAGETSAGDLARAASLSQATVTGILERLERRSLVQRQRSRTDRRRVLVELTDACRDILADPPPLLEESFERRFARLVDWERTQILASLQRLVALMETPEEAI